MKLHHILLLTLLIGAMGAPAMADPPSNMQVFTTSSSFTIPAGITKIEVEVRGGGGGSVGTGIGGCGGGYGKQVLTVTAGTVHAVTVGAGGAGEALSGNGTAGGTSLFGTLISATGGGGGSSTCAGGMSTATLNMTGFMGERNGLYPPFHRGGLCGDGSTRGSGGRGNFNAAGSPGEAGNVVVRW